MSFNNASVVLDIEWGLATQQLGDGKAYASRAQGYVTTTDTNNHAVRSTVYTPPATTGQRSVKSSSAADTAAGTGAQQVLLTYLDSTFTVQQETIVLNGVTGVNTVGTDILYVESLIVTQVGSGQINAGTISLMTAINGGGTTIASAAPGDQGTAYAHHYIPAGATLYIMGYGGGGTVTAGVLNLVHQQSLATPGAPTVQIGTSIVHPAAAQWDHEFNVPLVIPGPDLVWLNTKELAATSSQCWAGFEYIQD